MTSSGPHLPRKVSVFPRESISIVGSRHWTTSIVKKRRSVRCAQETDATRGGLVSWFFCRSELSAAGASPVCSTQMASQACIDVYLVDDVLCGDANTMLNAQQYAAEEAICCRQTRSLPCLFGKTNVMNATWLTGNPANQVLHLRKCSLNGHTFGRVRESTQRERGISTSGFMTTFVPQENSP